ncbi:MAG: HAMP domain-containing sensor histidine kinase [Actinomycetota bacterium]
MSSDLDAARAGRLPALFISRVRAAVGGYMLLLAVLGDPHLGYYPVAAWALLLTAVTYASVILVIRWRRSSRGWLVWVLIGVDTVLISVLAGLTGGGQSPFAPVLLLVVIAVAIRFGLRRAAVALGWTVPILVTLILLVPEPSRPGDQRARDALWWTGHLIAGAVLAGVLSDRLDLAHRRRSQAEAAAAVERQRLELERDLRRRLESLDEGRRAFLSSLLHEFRPSVASLSTLARALRREEELTADERSEMLERIDGYSHHLDVVLREVAEVLTSESLEAEHRLHQADIYLPQLVGEAAALSGLASERIVTHSKPGGNVVRSDPDKCLRVLVKMLEEAGRHAPPDGVIEVDIRGDDGLVEVSVTPGGGGDEEESLGLWIAARLAEAMGGGLTAEVGANGRGTVRATFGAQPLKKTPR